MGDWKRGKSTPGTHKLIEIASILSRQPRLADPRQSSTGHMVKEGGEEYFFDQIRQLNCHTDELTAG
jgi:hypothetical protein